jgi:hypothetical protein
VGATCSTHGRGEKCIQYFGWKFEGKRLLEDLDVNGGIILEWIVWKRDGEILVIPSSVLGPLTDS